MKDFMEGFYGEGWEMNSYNTGISMTTQKNSTKVPGFAFFSDTLRDALKVKEIRTRLWYTFFILVLVRVGTQLPLPFADYEAIKDAAGSLKDGAFRFACKNNVPVLPTFTTMRDTDKLDNEGYPIQAYTLHILSPIYPSKNLSMKENIAMMKKKNEEAWKEVYERVYGIPLTYLSKEKE